MDIKIYEYHPSSEYASLYYIISYIIYEYIHVSMIPNAEGSLRHRCIESQTSAVVKFDIRFVFSSPPSRLRRAKLSKVPGKFMHFIWRCPLSKLEKKTWISRIVPDICRSRLRVSAAKNRDSQVKKRPWILTPKGSMNDFPPLISTIRSPKIKCSIFLFVACSL